MRRGLVAIAALALVAGSACATGASSTSAPRPAAPADAPFEVHGKPVKTNQVDLPKSYRYVPAVIQVEPGTEVTWTNNDDFPHTVKLLDGSGVDKKLAVGHSASITFRDSGVVYYNCSLHPTQMRGKVIVGEEPRS